MAAKRRTNDGQRAPGVRLEAQPTLETPARSHPPATVEREVTGRRKTRKGARVRTVGSLVAGSLEPYQKPAPRPFAALHEDGVIRLEDGAPLPGTHEARQHATAVEGLERAARLERLERQRATARKAARDLAARPRGVDGGSGAIDSKVRKANAVPRPRWDSAWRQQQQRKAARAAVAAAAYADDRSRVHADRAKAAPKARKARGRKAAPPLTRGSES